MNNIDRFAKDVDTLSETGSNLTFANENSEQAQSVVESILRHSKGEVLWYEKNWEELFRGGDLERIRPLLTALHSRNVKVKIVLDEKRAEDEQSPLRGSWGAFGNDFEVKLSSESFRNRVKEVYDKEIHFLVGGNKYRLQIDLDENVQAQACFSNKELSTKLRNSFYDEYDSCGDFFEKSEIEKLVDEKILQKQG